MMPVTAAGFSFLLYSVNMPELIKANQKLAFIGFFAYFCIRPKYFQYNAQLNSV